MPVTFRKQKSTVNTLSQTIFLFFERKLSVSNQLAPLALLFQNSNIMNIMNMMYFALEIPNFRTCELFLMQQIPSLFGNFYRPILKIQLIINHDLTRDGPNALRPDPMTIVLLRTTIVFIR